MADAGREASTGGKPRTLLRLVPEARYAVGVHLDRDELTAVRVDLAGRVVAEGRSPLDFGAAPDTVVDEAVRAVARVCGDRPLLGVGVAAPGPLDWRTGVLGRVTGFPEWEGFPLREVLEGRLGVPVRVDKDTNAGVAAGAASERPLSGRPWRTCTSAPDWERGSGWPAGARSTGGGARRRGSSGTRCCCWTGRRAGAGGAGARRCCAWTRWPRGGWRRRRGSWGRRRRTLSRCWMWIGCCSGGGWWRGRRVCSWRACGRFWGCGGLWGVR